MNSSTLTGAALIVGTLAQVTTMIVHPTSVASITPEALAHEMQALVATHALALLSVPVVVFGLAGVTRRLGWETPAALFAFIVYAFAAIAIVFAAITDGLVNAELIPRTFGAPETALPLLKSVLGYNFQLNQACAKVYVAGSSLAIIFWSMALYRHGTFDRIVAIVGGVVGVVALAGLLSGHVRMSAHGFGLIVFLHAVWMIALGVAMIRASRVVSKNPVRADPRLP